MKKKAWIIKLFDKNNPEWYMCYVHKAKKKYTKDITKASIYYTLKEAKSSLYTCNKERPVKVNVKIKITEIK